MTDDLPRRLGRWDATSILVGTIIGSGIFLVPASTARDLASPGLLLLVWFAGGLLSLLGALTYAELGACRPHSGGQYAYLRDAFGEMWGFLFGWVLFLVIQTGSIAAVAVAFAQYLAEFAPMPGPAIKAVAVGSILGLSWINALSVRFGASVQNLFCGLKLVAIAALVAFGFSSGAGEWSHFTPALPPEGLSPALLTTFGAALVGVLWAYDGWNLVTFVAGEVKEPARSLPMALVGGVLTVTAVYVVANAAYLYLLGTAGVAMAPDDRVASTAARVFGGPSAGGWMAAGILASIFGCLNGMILSGPRVYFALAKDGLCFPWLTRLHPQRLTPVAATAAQAVWAALLALSGTYDQLFTYVIFVAWLFYGMTAAAIFRFRRDPAPSEVTYRVPGYPFTPALFVLLSLALVANTLVTSPVPSAAGLVLTVAGVPVYYWFRQRRSTGP